MQYKTWNINVKGKNADLCSFFAVIQDIIGRFYLILVPGIISRRSVFRPQLIEYRHIQTHLKFRLKNYSGYFFMG